MIFTLNTIEQEYSTYKKRSQWIIKDSKYKKRYIYNSK